MPANGPVVVKQVVYGDLNLEHLGPFERKPLFHGHQPKSYPRPKNLINFGFRLNDDVVPPCKTM